MRFAQPSFLGLLLIIPVLGWYYFKKFQTSAVEYSDLFILRKVVLKKNNPLFILRILRLVTLILLILAFARPQAGIKTEEVSTKGVDIVLCMDTSTSMRALDFKPLNRLDAAKQAAKEFIKGRKHDRIGIVVFSALAFTQCPLTLDYGAVLDFLEKTEIGMTQTDGTAIGTAIATSVNRLKDSTTKSKVIILLTDGRNNMGEIDPFTAAKAAQSLDAKIYTIGCGAIGGALYPVDDPVFGRRYVHIDEDLDEGILSKIAETTGGLYFRATSREGLVSIYKQIDKMEKTEIKVQEYTDYRELYMYFLLPALFLFGLEIVLANTILRKIP